MHPERWRQIEALYHKACTLQGRERAAYLKRVCAQDAGLREELESLLVSGEEAESFIETPAMDKAAMEMAIGEQEKREPEQVDAWTGKRVSHYQVQEKLGSGGMGVVYKAKDTELGRYVALKFMPPVLAQDQRFIERFRREARAASALDHANICTVHEIGKQADQPFIVMQFLEGETLREHLHGQPLKTGELLELSIQITDALEAAHQAGIIHRDIKPSNIFITRRGEAKILDFGLAKMAPIPLTPSPGAAMEPEGVTQEPLPGPAPQPAFNFKNLAGDGITAATTAAGESQAAMLASEAMGTAAYMSPEQARGEALDARTDLFSLGAVLYEMATGCATFTGPSSEAIRHAILTQSPIPPAQINPDVSPELQRIISKALEKDRELRYPRAAEMCADLKRLKRASESQRAGAHLGRWTAIALAGVVLAVGMPAWYWLSRPAGVSGPRRVLAVVAVHNMTGENSLDWLERGVAELLTTDLSQAKSLQVISTERVRSLIRRRTGGEEQPPPGESQQVARDVGADMFVSAALRKAGSSLSLDLRIQDAAAGKELLAEKVAGEDTQAILGMVDEATAGILARLAPGEENPRPHVSAGLTSNLEALQAYEKGLDEWHRVLMKEAAASFRRAVELDPEFAMAYYRLAFLLPTTPDFPAAREAMAKAADLANRLPLPRLQKLLIQSLRLKLDGQMEEAEKVAETAAREFPHETDPRFRLADILAYGSRWPEAKADFEAATRLDDHNGAAYNGMGYAYGFEGDLPRAMAALDRYAAVLPANDPNPYDTRGDVLAMNGHYAEAIAAYKKELELDPAFLDFQAASKLALTYLYEGDYSSAQETAQSAYERSKPDSGARGASISGDIDVGLGKLDQAEARYEESARLYEKQDPTLAFRLLLKAAQVNFEQRQPQALLALGHGHASPWAAGVRGLAYLIMKKNTAAEMEFAALRASVAPLVGEYRAGKIVELYRLEAAAYDGRWQEVMAIEPRLDGIPRNLYALEVGRAYLEAGPLSDAERQLRFALWAQRAWYNEEWLVSSSFLSFTLSEFYLGKVLEQTGRKDEAIKEYLQFLSHFENSPARLPQIAECRAALKRLK